MAAEKLWVNYNRLQQCPLQVRIVGLECWDSLVSGCFGCHYLPCDCLLLDMLIISLLCNELIQIVLCFLKRITMLKALSLLWLAFLLHCILYLLNLYGVRLVAE